jgi:hypothetical protein
MVDYFRELIVDLEYLEFLGHGDNGSAALFRHWAREIRAQLSDDDTLFRGNAGDIVPERA